MAISKPSDEENIHINESPVNETNAAANSLVAKSITRSIPKPKALLRAVKNYILNGITKQKLHFQSPHVPQLVLASH